MATIGAAGGKLFMQDGTAGLIIPANALTQDVSFTFAATGTLLPAGNVGPMYTFQPIDQGFLLPVTVEVPFNSGLIPMGHSVADVTIEGGDSDGTQSNVGGRAIDDSHAQAQVMKLLEFTAVVQ